MLDDIDTKNKRLVRPTLSAVLHAQKQLRVHLTKLAMENRPLADEEERVLFLREWDYATLGFGKDFEAKVRIEGYNRYSKEFCTDYLARMLSMWTKNEEIIHQEPNNSYPDSEIKVPISKYWNGLLNGAFCVFPYAIERATSMSKEQESSNRTKGFKI